MPVLNLPVGVDGPIVTVVLHLSSHRQQVLRRAKQPIPPPITGRGLIDSGASGTAVDLSVVQSLGLLPTGIANIFTPSTGAVPHTCNQYDISLGIVMSPQQVHLASATISVLEARLLMQGQGIHALIGRDVLAGGLFVFNGKANTFSLAF
jgi:hypothetical protein